MAKKEKSNVKSKVTFGRRKAGKAKKKYSSKEETPKKYRGQGR
jgi:hypothetical protein